MNFEFPEDEKFFADLLCKGRTSGLKGFAQLFDFRSPDEKRREFNKLRRKLLSELAAAYGGECMLKLSVCIGNRKLEVDHLIPLSSNELNKKIRRMLRSGKNKVVTQSFGSNHPDNLILACQKCNARKKHLFLQPEIFWRILKEKSVAAK